MSRRLRLLMTALIVALLVLAACGGRDEAPAAEAPEAAPLAQQAAPTDTPAPTAAPEPTEAPAAEAAPTEAPAEEPAEASAMVATVGEYLSAIPEGFMAVGQMEAFKEILATGEAVIIDVREPSEYEAGHVPGAVNVPIRTLAQNLDKVPTDKPVMLYCASGHRAGMATTALRTLGYDNVRAYPPGWKGWSTAGEEVSTEAVAGESYDVPAIDADTLAAIDGFLSAIPEGYYTIGTVEGLEEALAAGAVLIDVREESEFADGAIPGAISIPLRTLADNLDQIPTDQPVVVYCASGFRAALATAALHAMGYDNVRAFPPSYAGWEAAQGESAEVPAEVAAAVESEGVVAGVDAYLSAIPEGYNSVGKIEAFKDALENTDVYLIDVRETSEYDAGHIPGAVNLPIRTLVDNLDQIPTDQPVIVYCASGHRAGMATSALQELGYSNVKAFPPGWKGWSEAGEEASTEAVEPGAFTAPAVDAEMLAAAADFLNNIPEGFYALGDVEKLQGAIDAGAVLIDVREPSEYAEGHITDAINIPIRELGKNLDQIPTDVPVVVYCASGFRAALATSALHTMGYDNVRSFPPGYAGWEAAQ